MRESSAVANLRGALKQYIADTRGEDTGDVWQTDAPGRGTPGSRAAGTPQGQRRIRTLPEGTRKALLRATELLNLLDTSARDPMPDTEGGKAAMKSGGRRAEMGGALRRWYNDAA